VHQKGAELIARGFLINLSKFCMAISIGNIKPIFYIKGLNAPYE